ncbi:hypothetical protein AWC20_20200 [Mycobacterium parmense]|nr:hypothetical protein AWC20_20200 [Mycobacterium parmense]
MPGSPASAGSSTSTTAAAHPSSRSARAAVVTAATGAESSSTNRIRAAGTAGSIGTYVAPVFATASIATIASADRGSTSATRCPGPTPRPASRFARRFAAPSSSAYVSDRSSHVTATDSGVRAAWAANAAGIDVSRVAGWMPCVRLPQPSRRSRSPSSSTAIDDNRRCGSATIAASTRSSRLARSATSKFANGPQAPEVLSESWSPAPEKISPKSPTWPGLVKDADASTPAKSMVILDGRKLTLTLSPGCSGPRRRALRSRACTGNR